MEDILNTILEDDATSTGGVDFYGETLRDFLLSVNVRGYIRLPEVNKMLKECGIKPVAVPKCNSCYKSRHNCCSQCHSTDDAACVQYRKED